MYERKPSGLLRTGAMLLAVLMVFGNLYLPSGVFAAKAAETVPTTGVSFVDANGQAIDTLSVAAGTTNTLNLAFTPADAADNAVTFTSSNKSVADFDADGKLVAYQNGTTTVTVKLNSNETITDQLTVTVSAPMGKLPITEDFQDETAGLRNPFGLTGDAAAVATVFEKDGNKMLQVSNSSTLDHAQAFMSFRKNAGVYYKDTVYLSYWLLVSGTGRFYIPSLCSYFSSPNLAVYIAITNGAMEYATSLNGARTAVKYKDTGETVTYTDKQWILVEQTYTSTGTTGERKLSMSINGKEVDVQFADLGQVNGLAMYMTKWMENQVAYVDNITVTETAHEPMAKPTTDFVTHTTGISFVDANGQAIDTLSVAAGTTSTLNLAFTPADAADKAVTFTSSNKSVADFNADGKLVAYQNGTTTVTVKLNSNETITDQLTVTVSAPMGKLPITEDFQDETAGLRNPFGLVGDSAGVATVFEKDGNKMLQVSNSSTQDHAQAFMSFRKNAGVYYKDTVYLSYWLLVSGTGRFYIPSLCSYFSSPNLAVYIAITDGKMEYATSLNGSRTAVKYKDSGETVTYTNQEWILVEQTYTSTGTTGERKLSMSINGKEVDVQFADLGQVNGLAMYMTKWMENQVAYVDNITVTETAHEPMAKPTTDFVTHTTGISFVDTNGQAVEELSVKVQTATDLSLAFTPENGAERDVTFTSSDPAVANFVDGKLVAYTAGQTTITATLNGNSTVTAQLAVTVHSGTTNDWNTLPIQEEFTDATIGTAGSFNVSGDPAGSASVFRNSSGNQILAVANMGGSAHAYATVKFRKAAGVYHTGTLYLSYWMAVSGEGRFYIPTFTSYFSSNSLAIYITPKPDGTFEYAAGPGGPWMPLTDKNGKKVTYEQQEWILVEQSYTCAATNGDHRMTIKINGTEVDIQAAHRDKLTGVSMYMTNGMANQIAYVDNMVVSEAPHTPLGKPAGDFNIPATGVGFVDENGQAIEELTVIATIPTQLNVAFQPVYASDRDVSFTSSDPAIADFDENGNLVGKQEGEVIITVTLNSNNAVTAQLAVTVAPASMAFKMEEDFQDETEGIADPFEIIGSEDVYGHVYEKNNGNKLLQVSSEDIENHGYARMPLKNSAGEPISYKGTMYLSYWLATAKVNGVFYIPCLAKDNNLSMIVMLRGNGNFEYSTDGATWYPVKYKDDGKTATYGAGSWMLIEQVYTTGSDADAEVILKINGREVDLIPKGRDVVNGVNMQMTKWMGQQVVYVDNMIVSQVPHEPMPKPDEDFVVPTTGLSIVDANGQPVQNLTIPAQTPTKIHLVFNPMGATDRVVSYTSSNPEIADFNDAHKLVGYKAGTTTITVTLDKNTTIRAQLVVSVEVIDTESVTITDVELDAVADAEDTYTLVVGDHGYAYAESAPTNADYTGIIWSSSDPSVATVDSYGEILALKPGTTVITATSAQPESTVCDAITVIVTEPGVAKTIRVASVAELKAALAEVAAINAGEGMTGNIEIILAGGYYYLSETLKLGPAHSGTNGYSLIIKAAEDAEPVISGATVITGQWTKVEGKDYYSIQVPKTVDSRQLFVNNIRAVRARSQIGLTNSQFLYNGSTNIGYVSEDAYLAAYQYPQDLELVFFEEWTQPRCGVTQIVDNGDGTVKLIMDQPGWSGVGRTGQAVATKGGTSAKARGPKWIENALELLDETGEWYLDTHSSEEYNVLYYMPRPFEDLATAKITMPTLDNATDVDGCDGALVEISGTFTDASHNYVSTQVMNIHFEGITFADTTWMRPSTNKGHADAQNNYLREGTSTNDKLMPGAVLVEAANGIWFTGCTFTRLGINGLQMINGVQNSLVIGNHFFDISGNAITIGEPDTEAVNCNAQGLNLIKNNDILNNFIHDIGVDFGSSAAISVGHAAEMDMNHNELFNLPYSGWHIGYGWEGNFVSNNKNMLLEYNFVHEIMGMGIFDGGAVYTIGNTSGEGYNYIRRNYVRNQMNETASLYSDVGSTYYKYVENVVDLSESGEWHLGEPTWSFVGQSSEHIHFIDNFVTTSKLRIGGNNVGGRVDIVCEGMNVSPDASWTDPIALDVIANAGLEDAYSHLRNGQIERIKLMTDGTAYDGEDIFLKPGDRIQLSFAVSAIRAGQEITNGLHCDRYYYESLNPAAAKVDENGLIVAKGSGTVIIRLTVISNNVAEVKEVSILVNDVAADVALKDVEGDITLSKAAAGLQLTAVVTSSLGFERTPDSVTFSVADKNIAKVTADGYLTPATAGTTSLTVVATYGGVSVTRIFKVVINAPAGITESDAADMFDKEQEESWNRSNATNWEVIDDTSVTGTLSSYATFSGTKYDSELLCFKLKIDKVGISSNWPAIMLRAQDPTGEAQTGGTDAYMFCMGSNGVEVYRFVNGVRYVIRGDQADNGSSVIRLSGAEGVISPEASGFTYTDDVAEHDIKVGAIRDGENVRILLYVDGNKVLDYLDTVGSGAITEPGYFGMIGRGQTFVLTKAAYVVPAGAKESNAGDMFDKEQEESWSRSNATNWEVIDDTSVTGTLSSYATFSGKQYNKELLSFKLKINRNDITSDWPAIVLRAQGSTGEAQTGATDAYMFCMASTGIEVYRFVNGVRYVIRGIQADNGTSVIRLSGAEGVISPEVSGFTYTDGVAEHDIKVGAIADGENVRILLYVDGNKVLDYLDTAGSGAIMEPGYFGMIGRGQTFTLTKDTSIPDDTGDGEEDDEGYVDTEGKAAQIGSDTYDTIEEALAAAQSGDTVKMLADAEMERLVLTNGVKLDLNGFELSAGYVVAFDGNAIVDSAPGVGLVKSAYVSLAKNNDLMPVWDEAAGGYRLFGMRSSQMFLSQSADKFEFLAKPLLGNKANSVFMSQAETNGLTFKVRMSWTNASGNEVNQDFTLKGEDLKTIYSQAEQVVSLKVSGAGSYVNRLQVSCYIVSQTGVEWLSAPDLFVGQ